MILFVYGFIFLLGVGFTVYIYSYLKRSLRTWGVECRRWWFHGLLIAVAVCIAAFGMSASGIGAVIVIHIIMFSVILGCGNLLLRCCLRQRYKEGFNRWKWWYGSGLIPVILTSLFLIGGYYNMHHVVETSYTISTDKPIREEGYRVAMISDVHYGVSLDRQELEKVCLRISKRQPDLVVLCGDIVDDDTTKEQMQEVFEVLGSIENSLGIYYVYGNHDRPFSFNEEGSDYTLEELVVAMESQGIRILQDEVLEVTEDVTIIGREDRSFMYRAGMQELVLEADPSDFILTLDHQPNEYAENASLGTDLLLSGHTHNGQIWPINWLQEIVPFNDAVYGHEWIDEDTQGVVSSGLAGWMFPIKTAGRAEYVMIEIQK